MGNGSAITTCQGLFGKVEWQPRKTSGGDGLRRVRAGGQRPPNPLDKRRIKFCEFFGGHFAPFAARPICRTDFASPVLADVPAFDAEVAQDADLNELGAEALGNIELTRGAFCA